MQISDSETDKNLSNTHEPSEPNDEPEVARHTVNVKAQLCFMKTTRHQINDC